MPAEAAVEVGALLAHIAASSSFIAAVESALTDFT